MTHPVIPFFVAAFLLGISINCKKSIDVAKIRNPTDFQSGILIFPEANFRNFLPALSVYNPKRFC